MSITNATGQGCQRGDMLFDERVVFDLSMFGHRADHQLIALFAHAHKFWDLTQVNQLLGLHQALLHGGQQGLAAR